MKSIVCCYRDTKLGVYCQPFYLEGGKSKEDLIETVRRMCASEGMPSYYFEYDFYYLGEFDDKVGMFNCKEPEFLVSLNDFKHLKYVSEKKEEVSENVGA